MSEPAPSFPRAPTEHRSSGNRRVWVRYPCPPDTPGQMFDPTRSLVQQGTVRNLSGGGIGLLLAEPVVRGTVLKVEVDGWSGPRMVVVQVTHVQELAEGWLHGCELELPLSADQIRDLLLDENDAGDRRPE